jgi:MFS family permease
VKRVAVVVILGAIMSLLDTTVVNVALGTLSRELDASLAEIQWAASGYLLSLAAVIPVAGWATRWFGGRRVYVLALTVFTLNSALCAVASSPGELIAMRVIQGAGGGMLLPAGQIILVVLRRYLGGDALAPTGWTAEAFGHTFVWVALITAVALVPTMVLARVERRTRPSQAADRVIAPASS